MCTQVDAFRQTIPSTLGVSAACGASSSFMRPKVMSYGNEFIQHGRTGCV